MTLVVQLLGIVLLFTLVGIVRPFKFISGSTRKHYALAAIATFLTAGSISSFLVDHRIQNAETHEASAPVDTDNQESETSPEPRYLASDFYWDDELLPLQDELLAIANRIVVENGQCDAINANGITLSQNRGSPSSPVYFVTCEASDGPPFNVWFEIDDFESRESFAATAHIDRGRALIVCEEAARLSAANPSTVDFSTVMDASFQKFPNGRAILRSTFTAQNLVGTEIEFAIECPFDGSTLRDVTISEHSQ